MGKVYRTRRGLNISLRGGAEKVYKRLPSLSGDYSLYPGDFPTVVPRLMVREGDRVLAGDALFHDKRDARVRFCSPVSGEVVRIERAERRRVVRVVVRYDGGDENGIEYRDFGRADLGKMSREAVLERLLESGCWPLLRQRPFNVVPDPDVLPRAVFISTFDLAPLAPDMDFVLKDDGPHFQLGLDVLSKLSNNEVHLGVYSGLRVDPSFSQARGVHYHEFKGKYPVSNVGVQLHHVAPVSKGEVVWTVNPMDVVLLGRLFALGKYDARRVVSLCGPRVARPRYYLGMQGMPLSGMIEDGGILPDARGLDVRAVSGNVMTGTRESVEEGGLHFHDIQVSLLSEGHYRELFGWALPGFRKYSSKPLFPNYFFPRRDYALDTNRHGGVRSFVVSGEYERVFPMRIYPVHLIKAILASDIEGMENLGIYEVSEEDFALCDFVCTSKIEAQSIVRRGLDMMVSETR